MKKCYLLSVGVAVATLTMTPCLSVLAEDGQNLEIEVQQSLNIDTEEQEEKIEEVYDYVYTTNRVNIRTDVNTESEILLTADVGTELNRVETNVIQGWDAILIENNIYYILNEYLSMEPTGNARSIEQQLADSQISDGDLRYMSAIIHAEAGNQCQAGQQAVGIVVMNRINSDIYKDTVYDVIHEPGQFSPVEDGNLSKALALYDNGEISNDVINAAKYALWGNTVVYYGDIVYNLNDFLYFGKYVSGCRARIQDHMFK